MKSKTKHIVLWGAWYGSHNVGDQVLLLTITDILTRLLGDVRFTVLTDNPTQVNSYTQRDSRSCITALNSRKQFAKLISIMATCDLFVFGGGVPFYQERDHLFAMALLVSLARTFNTPYMTWTVSSQTIDDPMAKRLFRWVAQGARAVTLRDIHTHDLLRSCGVTRPMHLAADSGYWLEPAEQDVGIDMIRRAGNRDHDRPLVALTPRTLCGRNKDAERHYRVKTPQQFDQEIKSFSAALDWLWEHGYQPILVPMNTVAPDDDRIAARRVMAVAMNGNRALLIDEKVPPRAAPTIYQQCHCSYVARVHGSITSTIGNCPVMMYAFAPKHEGIMQAMELSEFILTEADATPQRTITLLAELINERERLRTSIPVKLEKLRQRALIPANLADKILENNYTDDDEALTQ